MPKASPQTLSLYDLDAAILEVEAEIIDAGGEVTEEQDARRHLASR